MRRRAELITIALGVVLMSACHRPPDMDLNVECVQLKPATTTLNLDVWDSNNNMGRAIHDEVQRMQLPYELRGFSGGTYFTTRERRPATHVLLLVPEPVNEAVELPVPQQGGDVVYLLRSGRWEPHPLAVANPSSHLIRVRPGVGRDGVFTIDVTGMGKWSQKVTLKSSDYREYRSRGAIVILLRILAALLVCGGFCVVGYIMVFRPDLYVRWNNACSPFGRNMTQSTVPTYYRALGLIFLAFGVCSFALFMWLSLSKQ